MDLDSLHFTGDADLSFKKNGTWIIFLEAFGGLKGNDSTSKSNARREEKTN